jgi:hypothetical protein
MAAALDAGVGAFVHLAGTFTPPPNLLADADRMRAAFAALLADAQAAKAARPDVTVADLSLLLEQVRAVRITDPKRARDLQHRYLALALQAVLVPSADELPGPPASWEDIAGRWTSPRAPTT